MLTIDSGKVPDEWKIIVAVPKEREFKKSNVRFYAKLTMSMRFYQTLTEKVLAECVYGYVPHQSMTLSEEEFTRKIITMNAPLSTNQGNYVFVVQWIFPPGAQISDSVSSMTSLGSWIKCLV